MWYEKPHKMSSVNYNKGTLIPAGTEVGYIAVEGPRSMSYKKNKDFDPYIEFSSKDDKTLFKITWQSKYHPKKTIKDYANLMFTNKPFELLTEGFNTKELEAIKNGSIVEGMSKRAVIVTVGIPPGHYTKSLDDNSWFHWISRFQKREICFDANEKSILCSK